MRLAALLPLLAATSLVSACVSPASTKGLRTAEPVFAVEHFFAGCLRGEGRLRQIFADAQAVAVDSRGRTEPDGTVVLDQEIRRGARPPERRQWRLRPAGAGRWTGTLSDAAGPVAARVRGNELRLSFPLSRLLRMEQFLYLRPGGQIADNRATVRGLGVPVAALDEVISRKDCGNG